MLQDTGHVLENLLLALTAEGLSATVHYDIDKEISDRLLGCDPKRETGVACVRIAGGGLSPVDSPEQLALLPRNVLDAGKVSEKEVFFKEIEQISLSASRIPEHIASPSSMLECLGVSPEEWQPIEPSAPPALLDFPTTIVRRRSARNFVPEELTVESFRGLLNLLCLASTRNQQPAMPSYGSCLSTGLLVQNVAGTAPGFYLCDFQNNCMGLVRAGSLNASMATACLDQQWLKNAALHFCFLADLDQLDNTWGARGYQYAMLEAGRLGETIYLAATSLGLGCCGIGAIYDDEARDLLGLGPSSALLYLVAAGPVKTGE